MIELKSGNLLTDDTEALVNTVNCVGVMGKGVAFQFKEAFPKNYLEYKKACKEGLVKPGHMFTVQVGDLINPKYIINFPTKRHWKGHSRIQDIQAGLQALKNEITKLSIKSIALPPLGCGSGGLDWLVVRPLIEKELSTIPDIQISLYVPSGAPSSEKIKINTKRPHLTKARALLILLMSKYGNPGYHLTLLEIQKLAYFLQELGEPLSLNYEKSYYGPYADNLNFVLQVLEGHFIRGVGDASRDKDKEIYLLPNAINEAKEYLSNDIDALNRLDEVGNIIYGFENPYGMELLSSAHWIMKENLAVKDNLIKVIRLVKKWNARKAKMFQTRHIAIAWRHLLNLHIFDDEYKMKQA